VTLGVTVHFGVVDTGSAEPLSVFTAELGREMKAEDDGQSFENCWDWGVITMTVVWINCERFAQKFGANEDCGALTVGTGQPVPHFLLCQM